MRLPDEIVSAVYAHAEDDYPRECCGAIWLTEGPVGNAWEVMRCANAQDELHARDPQRFPRDARIAYAISPQELLAINRRADTPGERLAVLYHSHPDADAYFSAEDLYFAAPFGEPSYPDTLYMIVSVQAGQARRHGCFAWDAASETYVETRC